MRVFSYFIFLNFFFFSFILNAQSISNEFESLGNTNPAIIKRAKDLDPNNQLRIVQKRTVDRNLRFEFGFNYGLIAGGDSYVDTNTAGAQIDFHLTPRWSIGVRHSKFYNQLTPEGKRVFNLAEEKIKNNEKDFTRPDIDYPISSTMAVLNWYPIYGKTSLMDLGIAQFDIYTLVGAGQLQLESGLSSTYSIGGGFGFWISQHFSARAELRYQKYQDEVYSGKRDIDSTVFNIGLGVLL